jgi:APA family basic amino acid/polyamine antiporter
MAAAVPDNRGISAVVGEQLGGRFQRLSANYLSAAVLFGPVAVALTAADFLLPVLPDAFGESRIAAASAVLFLCALLVMSGASFMGKFMLVLSSLTALLLLAGSAATLFYAPAIEIPAGFPEARRLGHALLLIFWSIIGWEVLGNYVEEVGDPARTMMRAMKISLIAIVTVYLLTSFALQNSRKNAMAALLVPLFGRFSAAVFGLLAVALCICTVVTVTGAVARQTAARLAVLRVPAALARRQTAVLAVLLGNGLALAGYAARWLSFESIVGASNTLFLANAFLGLAGGFRLIPGVAVRAGIVVLMGMLLLIFLFSPAYALILFALVTACSLLA